MQQLNAVLLLMTMEAVCSRYILYCADRGQNYRNHSESVQQGSINSKQNLLQNPYFILANYQAATERSVDLQLVLCSFEVADLASVCLVRRR
jgi:hypothetical protein